MDEVREKTNNTVYSVTYTEKRWSILHLRFHLFPITIVLEIIMHNHWFRRQVHTNTRKGGQLGLSVRCWTCSGQDKIPTPLTESLRVSERTPVSCTLSSWVLSLRSYTVPNMTEGSCVSPGQLQFRFGCPSLFCLGFRYPLVCLRVGNVDEDRTLFHFFSPYHPTW